MTCKLETGVTRDAWTQRDLKELVGRDVRRYHDARGVQTPLDEKPRCWSLLYRGEPGFHMDIVPCIPQHADAIALMREQLGVFGLAESLAKFIADLSVSITDKRHRDYNRISSEWPLSNPQGFALWFESRTRLASALLEARCTETVAAKIDGLPAWRWKTPLQRAIQLLKRHRDCMFSESPNSKPISIIITTLAGLAYEGEQDLAIAVTGIIDRMESFIGNTRPRVPNPTDPNEDFADKWNTKEGRRLNLEDNFRNWIHRARRDFADLGAKEIDLIRDSARNCFGVNLNPDDLRIIPGISDRSYEPPKVDIVAPARPWRG